jgi:hypothetical protein
MKLTSEPVLKLPDLDGPFVLRTDASNRGLGAVLLQEQDGLLHPVGFASRKLSAAESRYSTIEKECLAIVWGVGKFNTYLYGRSFILESDHCPLQFLQSLKPKNGRLTRWAMLPLC